MNPLLASAIVLILRWLQLIASRGITEPQYYGTKLLGLIDETTAFSDRLYSHTITDKVTDTPKKEVN